MIATVTSHFNADDSIMVERGASPRGGVDPLMDPSAYSQLNSSRTAQGAQRNHLDNLRMRKRDRRGVYQSIDATKTQTPQQQEEQELRKAEDRLRTIEMISRYREDKIKAEFRKLESDLQAQDQKNALEKQRSKERRNYFEKQKKRTKEIVAARQQHNDSKQREEDPVVTQRRELSRKKYQEAQKQKLQEHKRGEMKEGELSSNGNESNFETTNVDPMRVPGSFYKPKKASKSPANKKVSPNHFNIPERKAKLRLAPLMARNAQKNFATQ